jgi:hypothetical protein
MIYGSCILTPLWRWIRGKKVQAIRRFPVELSRPFHAMWKEDGEWYHFKADEDLFLGLWFTGSIEPVSDKVFKKSKK